MRLPSLRTPSHADDRTGSAPVPPGDPREPDEGRGPPTPVERRVWEALTAVIDPEVGLDIVTMGMVYDVTLADGVARVTHTLTIQGCPMEAHITAGIQAAASSVEGVGAVETKLVWEPPWHPGMIRDGAR